ncbi:protein nanos-like [Anopheles albimanus]|uniref:protein nanos-like n=1 Tax=Anopheles albimanus TaxID=7167 RepID=UPI001641CDDC|nr:protein nanos-like [Anopheles albimanus]
MNFDPIMYAKFLEAEKLEEIRREFAANGTIVDSSGESSDEEACEKSPAEKNAEQHNGVRRQLKDYVKNTLALYHLHQYMSNIVPQEEEPETLVNSMFNMSVADRSETGCSSATPSGCPPRMENVLDEHNSKILAAKEKKSTSSTPSMIPRRCKSTLRSQNQPPQTECVFCRNNGEPRRIYESHVLRDENKAVVCPKLRSMRCMQCGATGSKAHTLKYCPYKPIITPEDLVHMEATLWRKHRDQRSSVSSTSSNVRRHLRN